MVQDGGMVSCKEGPSKDLHLECKHVARISIYLRMNIIVKKGCTD